MTAIDVLAVVCIGVGSVFVLAELPWFRTRRLAERLRPYVVGAAPRRD